jgi:putative cell wall-binding protein
MTPKRWLVIAVSIILAVPVAAQGTVVIVSDSDCDVAMAELLASVTEARIVKVEWGQFDENALVEVVESDPDDIIIIGGSMAVVEQIQKMLDQMGFSIFRVAGRDRAQTSLELYRAFQEHFNNEFAVVVVDTSKASIVRGKKLAIQYSVPLFFCDISQLDDMLEQINQLGIEEIRIITSNRQDDLRTICEKRLNEASERLAGIEFAEEDVELQRECEELLKKATESFEDGNYLLCLQYLTELEKLLNELQEE